jgi:hypothetical protein
LHFVVTWTRMSLFQLFQHKESLFNLQQLELVSLSLLVEFVSVQIDELLDLLLPLQKVIHLLLQKLALELGQSIYQLLIVLPNVLALQYLNVEHRRLYQRRGSRGLLHIHVSLSVQLLVVVLSQLNQLVSNFELQLSLYLLIKRVQV